MTLLLHRLALWFARRPLLRFFLAVAALLPAAFVAWYFLGAVLCGPSVLLADLVLTGWLPELVERTELTGTQFMVWGTYGELNGRLLEAEAAGNQLAYPVNTRTLSYSMPFFVALYLATPQRGGLDRPAWAFIALWLLLAVGLIATTLKNLMLGLGDLFFAQGSVPPADAIALVYQLSVLLVPPLAPVILWAYCASDSPAFRSLLALAAPEARTPDQARDSRS